MAPPGWGQSPTRPWVGSAGGDRFAEAALAGRRAAGQAAGLGVGQRLAQQAGEGVGVGEGEVQAVGLEPVAVAGAVDDPVEQDAALGVALGGGADGVGIGAGAAAELERDDQAKDPFGPDQAEGGRQLAGGDAGVGAEGDPLDLSDEDVLGGIADPRHRAGGAGAARRDRLQLVPERISHGIESGIERLSPLLLAAALAALILIVGATVPSQGVPPFIYFRF